MTDQDQPARQQIAVNLDPALILALDALVKDNPKASRSDILGELLGVAIQARHQKKQKEKEQKVNLTLRVSKQAEEQIRRFSMNDGRSVNQTAAHLLELGIISIFQQQELAPLQILRNDIEAQLQTIKQAEEKQAHRLAYLLSRTIIESLENREIMRAILYQSGLDVDTVDILLRKAEQNAVRKLTKASPKMHEAIKEIMNDAEPQ